MHKNGKTAEQIKYWIGLARYDLITAEAMLEAGRFLYVGFMCHQVIEKSLKACYVSRNNSTPPYLHNLAVLAEKAMIASSLSQDQQDFLDELQPLNVESRYPTHKSRIFKSLSRRKCSVILTKTKLLFKWLIKQL